MIVVHLNSRALAASGEGGLSSRLIELLVTEKSRTIFGILFGASFALQLARAEDRGDRFVWPFLRRVLALAAFGLVDWTFGYNVLMGYALPAPLLLVVRRWPVRALVPTLIVCAMWGGLSREVLPQWTNLNQSISVETARAVAIGSEHSQSSGLRAVVAARWRHNLQLDVGRPGAFLILHDGLTLFLIGLLGLRLGVWDRPRDHRRLIATFMVYGAVSWAMALFVAPADWAWGLIASRWLVFTYVGAVLLMDCSGSGDRHLSLIGSAGRTALSHYLIQLVVIAVVFGRYGIGLVLPPALVPGVALAFFVLLAVCSRWWLKRFRIGPAEWVLRSATHARLQPMRWPVPGADAASSIRP